LLELSATAAATRYIQWKGVRRAGQGGAGRPRVRQTCASASETPFVISGMVVSAPITPAVFAAYSWMLPMAYSAI
jgi:hypothetical protein